MTRFSLKLPTIAAALASVFAAQSGFAQTQPAQGMSSLEIRQPEGAEELSRHLARLATNPRDIEALIGAGEAALKLNDARAAAGFFARAQEVSPSNHRVKTGLARSMLGMENPVEALRLFKEAVVLGAREADIAGDRGLAFDLTGDPVRAQQDYQVALSRSDRDPILIRRYAVSLGISGKWQEADKLLDPLLRKSDKAAWRDRAFILAMNGQTKQAQDITTVMMPRNMAAAIQPFMDRMPTLTPAQRAAAVHFGNFPAGIRAAGAIPRAPIAQSAAGQAATAQPPAPSRDRRNRTQASRQAAAPVVTPQPVVPQSAPATRPVAPPAQMATSPLPPSEPRPLTSRRVVPQPERIGPPAQEPALSGQAQTTPAAPAIPVPAQEQRSLAQIMSSVAVPEAERTQRVAPVDLAEIARIQAEKRKADQAAALKAKAAVEAKAKAKIEAEAKAKAKAEADEKARNPARIWVQIATGRDPKALAFDMGKLRKKYPDLLKNRDAWTSPWGATRRMVVGPFDTTPAAKSFYSDWTKAGGDGFIWQSTDGLEVEKLAEK